MRILAFAGSLRKDSYNRKLVRIAAEGARAAGVEVTLIDLKDYPLPVYDGDLETTDGLPAHAKKLKEIFFQHQGLLIASPEYNSSIPGGLKNMIDWISRTESKEEPPLACFSKKIAAILSASPGGLGGLRGLAPLRMMLGNLGVLVLPMQIAVSKAHEAFDADGFLKDVKQGAAVRKLGAELAQIVLKLSV
jgi:NAD(P)H-dependent FMN reductase